MPALRLGRPGQAGAMNYEERMVAGLRVRIDRTLCVAFETCIDVAPQVFRFDEEGIVSFVAGDHDVTRERLIEACNACPVDALSLFDGDGADLLRDL